MKLNLGFNYIIIVYFVAICYQVIDMSYDKIPVQLLSPLGSIMKGF